MTTARRADAEEVGGSAFCRRPLSTTAPSPPVPTSEQAGANSLFGNAVCVDVTREIFKSLFFQEDASMYPMYPALFNP